VQGSNDLYSLIQELNLEKVILVGHSMGGMTALTFALNHPDKVSKLVLIGTSAKMSFSGRVQLWNMLHIFSYESLARRMIDFQYYEPSEQVKEKALERAMKTNPKVRSLYRVHEKLRYSRPNLRNKSANTYHRW
jgi:pimeloyl-ACP methyl ester carboxylesterase